MLSLVRKQPPSPAIQSLIGAGVGVLGIALFFIWSFWGRAFQAALALVGVTLLFVMLRYPAIGSAMFGFIMLSGAPAYIPKLTVLFYAGMIAILFTRKLITGESTWRLTPFIAMTAVFIAWFQVTGLWVEQYNNYNWALVYRVLLGLLILSELISDVQDYVVFAIGAAVGMLVTSVSAIVSAYRFYTTGAAEQIAGAVANIEQARFYGYWLDPNIMSITLVTFLGLTIALWRSRISWPIRWLMAAAAVLSVLATFISLSRAGMIGCLIVVILMLAVERKRILLSSVFVMILIFVLAFVPIDFIGRVTDLVQGDRSTSERGALILSALRMFTDNVWFGGGMGSFEHNILSIMRYLPSAFFSHNTFLDIAVDSGIVGLILFCACLWFAARPLSWSMWEVDHSNIPQMIHSGLRASFVATCFMLLTMSMTSYVPVWSLLILTSSLAYIRSAVEHPKTPYLRNISPASFDKPQS